MLTPQEVSERGFTKVSFGGYNMVQVDEFLDILTGDYTTLYSENTALKRKIKVMQDKIDEYRTTEETMRKALSAAQQIAETMVQEGKTKTQKLMDEARQEIEVLRKTTLEERQKEEQRLLGVKQVTAQYVEQVRALHNKEREYLDSLGLLVNAEVPMPDQNYVPPVAEPPMQAAPPMQPQMQQQPMQQVPQQPMQQGLQGQMPPQMVQQQPMHQMPQQPMQQGAPDSSGMSNDVQAFLERAMADALGEKKAAEISADDSYRTIPGVYQPMQEEQSGESIEATTRFLLHEDFEVASVGSRQMPMSEDSEYDAEMAEAGSRLDFSRLQQEFGQKNQ